MKPTVYFSWIKDKKYKEVWDIQTSIHQNLVTRKLDFGRTNADNSILLKQENQLIFCEHFPVFTLGKSGSMDHLLLSEQALNDEAEAVRELAAAKLDTVSTSTGH